MRYLDADAVKVRESEWIKIGVDTGARKMAWPGVSHTGRGFLAMLTLLSAQQLENLASQASDCTSKVATIGESMSEFEVNKRRCVSHCCMLESTRRWMELQSCLVTKVTCST